MKFLSNKRILIIYAAMAAFLAGGYFLLEKDMMYDKVHFYALIWELLFFPTICAGPVLCIYALRKNLKFKGLGDSRMLTIVLSCILLGLFLIILGYFIYHFAHSVSAILRSLFEV